MTPDYADSNPYQRQLAEGLERRGVHVDRVAASPYFPILRACWRTGVPDVVHLHWVHAFVATDRSIVAAALAVRLVVELAVVRLLGANVVWTVHNVVGHERSAPRIELALRHAVARLSTGTIVHCEAAIERVVDAYRLPDGVASRIHVVPHGHYIDAYENDLDRAAARDELGLSSDATALLYFGLIRRYKNVPELVETFRSIDDEDVRLLVVGNPRTADLGTRVARECAADDRIRSVLEFVPDDEIQRYMNAADAVVLPFSDVLTSGSVLLGMSFGRAVIVPDVGCPARRVTDAGGFTYDPSDPDGLRRAMERALDPETDLQAMGERNRRAARELDWDSIAARTVDVYLGRGTDAGRTDGLPVDSAGAR